MRSIGKIFLTLVLAALLPLLPGGNAHAQKENNKSVSFRSFDGVELVGTFYPATKREAVVILLHDFTQKEGGSSSKGKWPTLAQELQKDGYAVLAFDFRGFGESRRITPATFFDKKFTHNGPSSMKGAGLAKPPESLDQKNFNKSYFPYLINDIAAAKAYLDRRNDANEVNSSSIILIGAGQGATLAAMWARNECLRRKDKNPNPGFGAPMLGEPEGKDIAALICLGLSPNIENKSYGGLRKWLTEVGRTHKIPIGLFHGKDDTKGSNYAAGLVKDIKGTTKDLLVATRAIEKNKSSGVELLDSALTTKNILGDLATVMEKRGNKERLERKSEASAYYYLVPPAKLPQINKRPGEEAPGVDMKLFTAGN